MARGTLRIAGALAAERNGQPALALARLRAVFDPDSTLRFAELTPEDSPLWLPDVVRLALAMGEPPVAHAATEACTAAADQQRLPFVAACARHCCGLLTADPTPLHAAADVFAEVGYPFFGAQALENAAVVHAERGEASAARAAYGQAMDTYTELGAAWGLMRADARLRPLGIRRGVRGARRRPSTGWEGLTAAESKIAQLVADRTVQSRHRRGAFPVPGHGADPRLAHPRQARRPLPNRGRPPRCRRGVTTETLSVRRLGKTAGLGKHRTTALSAVRPGGLLVAGLLEHTQRPVDSGAVDLAHPVVPRPDVLDQLGVRP